MSAGMIISIAGFSRAGKDTVGRILCDEFGFRRYAYADKLKALAQALTVTQRIEIDGNTEYVEVPYWDGHEETKRQPCVQLGKAARDLLHSDVWIDSLMRDERLHADIVTNGVVVTDCRYLNETRAAYDLAARLGATHRLWWIDRPGIEPQGEEAEATLPLRALASRILDNSRNLDYLAGQIRVLMSL